MFFDELTNWMTNEAGFNQSKFQMFIYYKYAPDGTKSVVLSYFDECIYWYTYEELVKWFLDTLIRILHVNFLGYENWFISTRISQLKAHYISVDKARYDTPLVAKYLDTATIKQN